MFDDKVINRRLWPSSTDSDYYLLTCLRSKIEKFAYQYQASHNDKIRILDFGCGDTPYRKLFEKSNVEYIAADLEGNKFADMIIGQDGIIPSVNESFDLVVSFQVLEHVTNPVLYLTEAFRVLKHDGYFLLSTHGWWTYHPYPNDYWRWTREGLVKIIKQSGLDVLEIEWVLGMLAYSCQLRVQCLKGLLEDRGIIASNIFRIISFFYQKTMRFADMITPNNIAIDNASIYVLWAKKNLDKQI